MFASAITRPLRWALPLWIIGLLGAVLVDSLPVHSGDANCGSVVSYFAGGSPYPDGHWFAYAPGTQPTGLDCPAALRRRSFQAFLIGLGAGIPLAAFAVRGFIWGAATLDELSRRPNGSAAAERPD